MRATNKNVAFVNFRRDPKSNEEIFGISDLFQKIRNVFHETKDYKKSLEKLTKEKIEEQALKLKEQANKIVLWNKIGGGIVGIIPGVDWALQRFVIKKNAAKKIGMIFGIDLKFIENNQEKQDKLKKKMTGMEKEEIYYEEDALDLEIDGDALINESSSYKIGNAIKIGGDTGSILSGAISLGIGFSRAAIGAGQVATESAEIATEVAVTTGSIVARTFGFIFLGVGVALGVSSGAYFTTKHCNELIDKFYNFYINNAEKISNSYKLADEYLKLRSLKE